MTMLSSRRLRACGWRGAVMLGGVGLLAACAGNSQTVGSICPSASVIYGLERAELALGPPASPEEAPPRLSFRLGPLQGQCTIEAQSVRAEYDLDLTLNNLSGKNLENLTVSYFIVVVAPDGTILDKSVFDVGPIELLPGGYVSLPQAITQTVTLDSGSDATGYEILAGFQLPDDVANRQRIEY